MGTDHKSSFTLQGAPYAIQKSPRVLVIGVGGSSYDGEEGGGTPEGAVQITLLVSPREAELLAQAQCGGEISIALCPTAGSKGGE